jgi:hypothetical protein
MEPKPARFKVQTPDNHMLLIDAYNVLWLGHASEPHGPDLSVSGLLRLVAHSRYRRRPIQLVCDGFPPQGEGVPAPSLGSKASVVRLGPGEIVYSGHAGSADDVIERILAAHSSPRSLLVVSSDNRIKRAAGRRRAANISSEAFLKQILADRVRTALPAVPAFVEEIPLGTHAIELWRREFGLAGPDADAKVIETLSPKPLSLEDLEPAPTRDLRAASGRPQARTKVQRTPDPQGRTPGSGAPAITRLNPMRDRPAQDAELEGLMQEWGLRFDLDDLDMARWLDRGNEGTPG